MSTNGEPVSVEYVSRALLKHARAAELFESLELAIDRWNEEHQLMAPARSPHDGEQRLEFFRPEAVAQAPLNAWESVFHDGVHNLRVALDTLCFELCHLEQTPQEPGKIHFPITDDARQWPGRTAHLGTIPAELLDRIRQCQPWSRESVEGPDPLVLISRIDNVDKHRASGVAFDVMPMGQWALRPSAPIPPELANAAEWPPEPWMQMTLSPPVDRGWAALVPVMAVPIVMFDGLFAILPDAQRWLYDEVRRIISFIASGEWPDPRVNRFLPGPIWSVWPGSSAAIGP